MQWVIFLVFIFGTIIGSFLNVVILRYDTGERIINSRSRCFSCGKKLKWHELVPVLSFVIQLGKCRSCKKKISWQYPLIEILAGLLLVFLFTRYSLLVTSYYFVIFSLLIIIAVYDLRHQIIPDIFVYAFGILTFLNLFRNLKLEIRNFDLVSFLTGLILFAFFASLWFFSHGRAMGLGDAKLALGIGWFLGLFKGFLAFIFSFWAGAIVGIFLLIFLKKKYNMKSKVAFGPFLALGTILAFFLGDVIIKIV